MTALELYNMTKITIFFFSAVDETDELVIQPDLDPKLPCFAAEAMIVFCALTDRPC